MKNTFCYETILTKSEYKLHYLFESNGKKKLIKVIEYMLIELIEGTPVFNLGFGDYDSTNDNFTDDTSYNNGDHYIIFNTVLNSIPEFFKHFPQGIIMVSGSDNSDDFANKCKITCSKKCESVCRNTKRRMKIYRHFIDKNFHFLSVDYSIFGRNSLINSEIVPYIPKNDYDELFVCKK